jgi:uncharacterized membrane protein (DUF2068 family)
MRGRRGWYACIDKGSGETSTESVANVLEVSEKPMKKKRRRDDHASGLLVVGLYKLGKAIFFGAAAAEALHLIHANLGNVAMKAIDILRIDPEGHFASVVMDRVDLIGHHQLRQAGLYSAIYAMVCLVEGIGLLNCQGWAEYFTVVLTAAALPWEIYELVRRFEMYKVGLMAGNMVVLVYLVWVLWEKRKKDRARMLARVNAG